MMRRILSLLAIAVVAVGGFYLYKHNSADKVASATYQTKEEASNIYVRFAMEAYDKIEKNYWGVSTTTQVSGAYNLPQIFELSLEKVLNRSDIATPVDRAATARTVAEVLKTATSTEAQKSIVLQTVAVALYNLQPVGRNALFTTAQEKTLRDEVANVNPDTKEIEPTVFAHIFNKTLYLNVTQIAPQTLQEIGAAIEMASSTPFDSMILDFRGNIGGAMEFAPAFLGIFIGQDQYALDLFSHGEKQVIRTQLGKYPGTEKFKEVAIITDDKTQSTAELTTDIFKRARLGKSVGVKSKGWGTIENTYPLETEIDPSTKYTLLLVNSLTVREDNQPIEGNGVVPDVDTTKPNWQSLLGSQFHSQSLINTLKETASKEPLK